MNCDWVQENIPLYLYKELGDDAQHEVEQHVLRCTNCASELAAQREFHEQMNALPVMEPTANFLAASRMRLQEALEHTAQKRAWYQRFTFDPLAWMRQVRFSPALAMILVLAGFGGGLGTMYSALGNRPVERHNPSGSLAIGGITSIEKEAGTSNIQVKYDTKLPETVQGSVSDPKVRDLLLYAAKSNENSGVRLNSIDVLSSKADDPQVRETLTYALRYDSNPGVRLMALDGVGSFVKQDIRVRNAVLEVLLNDSNLGVRSGALHALEPVKADSSVRMALEQLAKEDPSEYIRGESKRVLAAMPSIY